eukprot:CAMPEP_0197613056 /NCGR_PEP_ID=MMETSP1326-20131121/58476_1 /TAXON_ID=1155430 /ORGANISM="Genus nov. species nov., Strain RCC2288" /LENGTH=53 /DNA_ID=CAMNT_0043181887 /DNA_START=21 /DNA_END=179 /DNA_ORIENTATION=+
MEAALMPCSDRPPPPPLSHTRRKSRQGRVGGMLLGDAGTFPAASHAAAAAAAA